MTDIILNQFKERIKEDDGSKIEKIFHFNFQFQEDFDKDEEK